jgi:hypothetical protein
MFRFNYYFFLEKRNVEAFYGKVDTPICIISK